VHLSVLVGMLFDADDMAFVGGVQQFAYFLP